MQPGSQTRKVVEHESKKRKLAQFQAEADVNQSLSITQSEKRRRLDNTGFAGSKTQHQSGKLKIQLMPRAPLKVVSVANSALQNKSALDHDQSRVITVTNTHSAHSGLKNNMSTGESQHSLFQSDKN